MQVACHRNFFEISFDFQTNFENQLRNKVTNQFSKQTSFVVFGKIITLWFRGIENICFKTHHVMIAKAKWYELGIIEFGKT